MNARRERRRSSRTALTSLEVRERWPLHWLVWEGRDAELEAALKEGEVNDAAIICCTCTSYHTKHCMQ